MGVLTELAMIRQRAAALNGLAEYPSELVRLSERLDRYNRAGRGVPHEVTSAFVAERRRVLGELVLGDEECRP